MISRRDLGELRTFWSQNPNLEKILCTIISKDGSAYRGPGAKKIILKNGESCGYLSGGCLDGDIVQTALDEWDSAPFTRSFSTMSPEDRLMGYQTGCAGVITILFEKLPNDIPEIEKYLPYGQRFDIAGVAVSLKEKGLGDRIILDRISVAPGDGYFIDEWVKPINLYVIGCGANARPFAELAPPLGWDVTFLDYRKGNTFPESQRIKSKILPIEQISDDIPEGKNTYVVVMTHNYEADMTILAQLNKKSFGYLGCVGPRKRFEQIQADLKKFGRVEIDTEWAKSVHAPAGLKQGRSPEEIAFSIIAQIQLGEAA